MNEQVLSTLEPATKAGRIAAQLIRVDGAAAPITLLYNPESRRWGRQAVYAEAETGGTSISEQNYVRTKGRTLELPDLLLDGHAAGRSLNVLISAIESLLLPLAETGSPPPILFSWGSELFGPAVLSGMQVNETGWLSGAPAIARMSLSLLQLPADPVAALPTPTGATNLTERQQADGQAQASNFIDSNVTRLGASVRSALNAGRTQLQTTAAGDVTLADLAGNALGNVGNWDGFTFTSVADLIT